MNDRIINIFMDLIKVSSPSNNENDVRQYILRYLDNYEIIKIVDDNGNVIADYIGTNKGTLLFDAHMDTVKPCSNISPVIKDGKIFSDGTTILGADDKAGIAVMLELIDKLYKKELKTCSIRFVFSVSEEIGLFGAKKLDDKYLKNIDFAFVLDGEGGPGSIVNRTPYGCKGELKFIGKEAHAGVCPEEGINALWVAAQAIVKMPNGRINENTTCNIGTIDGGVATNVVMPEVSMKFEARSYNLKELQSLINKVETLCGETAKRNNSAFISNLKYGTKGYYISENDDIMILFKEASRKSNLSFKLESCGGGSNANVYRQRGVNSVNIGIGMKKVHTCEEYIEIKDIQDTLMLIIKIAELM